MFKLINTEAVIIGRKKVTDPFGDTNYYNVWGTKRTLNMKGILFYAVMLIMVGTIIGAFLLTGSNNAETTTTSTTVAETTTTSTVAETTTTVAETVTTSTVTEISNKVYGPEWVKRDLYVCNTESNSTEYRFLGKEHVWSDGVQREIPWATMITKEIVLLWSIDDEVKYNDFVNDIALFNEYTHAGVRVEQWGYSPRYGEFVVPVLNEDIEGDVAWADMHVELSILRDWSMFGKETGVEIYPGRFRFDDLGLENWEYHTHMVLHEMGHLFGLDHTHDGEGRQTDSIMSYESDYNVNGYLPGDIAGLQEVFC